LQVSITWEDILQEEHNIGIFDMELEDLDGDEDEDGLGQAGAKVCALQYFFCLTNRVAKVANSTLLLLVRSFLEEMNVPTSLIV
jgi:hypothetical protein